MDRIESKIVVVIHGHTLWERYDGICVSRKNSDSDNASEVDVFLESMIIPSRLEEIGHRQKVKGGKSRTV
jgi:hypothetical protein